jgi:hypothetical protein
MHTQGRELILAGYPPSFELNLFRSSGRVNLILGWFGVMSETVDSQIRQALWKYAEGKISLDDFRAWFVPISWNIEESHEPQAIQLTHQIDGILAEASSADWSESDIYEELSRLFLASPLAARNQAGANVRTTKQKI